MDRVYDFPSTRWSLVLSAAGFDERTRRKALEELCLAYWYPLYAFARRNGLSVEDSRDAVQSFFLKLLESNFIRTADSARGRFRVFLLTVFWRFLKDERAKASAQKRGGGTSIIEIGEAEARLAASTSNALSPSAAFDREWAFAIYGRVLKDIRQEYVAGGKVALFERLLDFLPGSRERRPVAEVAVELGTTEGAIRQALLRLRRRIALLAQNEIAQTVTSEAELKEELRYFIQILSDHAPE